MPTRESTRFQAVWRDTFSRRLAISLAPIVVAVDFWRVCALDSLRQHYRGELIYQFSDRL